MSTLPWHSTLTADRPLYHDDTRCPEADAIKLRDRRPGTGGRPHCEHCARYSRQELRDPPPAISPMSARGPALPETDEPRCPYCRSHRIAPVGYVMAARGLIKEAHRCEVCKTAFFVMRPAIA